MTVAAEFPRNNETASIAFVGDAPGDVEEMMGAPIAGGPARIFAAGLRAAGINRGECLVTNVFDEPLPGKDIAAWCQKTPQISDTGWSAWSRIPVASGKYLTAAVLEPALIRLRNELIATAPKAIVTFGPLATWAVCRLKTAGQMKKLRGTPLAGVLFNAPVLPTYHPGYILRAFHLWLVFASDLIKAAKLAREGITATEYEVLQINTPADIPRMLASLEAPVSVDIETTFAKWIDCIGFSDARRGFVVPFFDNRTLKPAWSEIDEVRARAAVCTFLRSDTPKIFQNGGGYDLQVLWETWRAPVFGYAHDTRILHRNLFPELPADLASMASLHTLIGGGHKQEYRAGRTKEES